MIFAIIYIYIYIYIYFFFFLTFCIETPQLSEISQNKNPNLPLRYLLLARSFSLYPPQLRGCCLAPTQLIDRGEKEKEREREEERECRRYNADRQNDGEAGVKEEKEEDKIKC